MDSIQNSYFIPVIPIQRSLKRIPRVFLWCLLASELFSSRLYSSLTYQITLGINHNVVKKAPRKSNLGGYRSLSFYAGLSHKRLHQRLHKCFHKCLHKLSRVGELLQQGSKLAHHGIDLPAERNVDFLSLL